MMPRKLLLFVLIISFLVTFVQLQVFQIAFSRLGLSPGGGLLLVVCALLGSPINIPVGSVDSSYDPAAVRNPPGGQVGHIAHHGQAGGKIGFGDRIDVIKIVRRQIGQGIVGRVEGI